MEDLLALLLWCMVSFGIVNGAGSSSVFTPTWNRMYDSRSRVVAFVGKMLLCPMCLGFWVGGLLHYSWFSPTSQLGCVSPLNEIFHVPADMFLSSASCWFLYNLCLFFHTHR